MNGLFGEVELTMKDIEDYLASEGDATPASTVEKDPPAAQQSTDNTPAPKVETETQAFAHRLKEATNKARMEERESIAKGLGYESFSEMQKSREEDLIKTKGLDPTSVAPVIEEIVQKRLSEDPRMQELENIRAQRAKEWAEKELEELKELTGGKIQTLSDVPKDVIELWKTKGSLTGAYLDLKGKDLIREMREGIASEQSKGSTTHLNDPSGSPTPPSMSGKRLLTDKEKEIYRLFNPTVTEEQLNKMTKDK